MSAKNFLSIPSKIIFSSPQALGKSPTKIKFFSPQVHKVSKNIKSNVARKLQFEANNKGTLNCFHLNNKIQKFHQQNNEFISEFQNNCSVLYLDSPTKRSVCLHGLVYPNKFRILGRGNFGVTLKAIYQGQFITAKIIKNRISNHKSIRNERNFLNVSHSNVVRIYGVIFKNTDAYGIILMEDCSSYKSLRTFLTQENMDDCLKKRIALGICYGVQAIHKENIVHLDLKPQNILINYQQRVKICDFGSSFNLRDELYTLYGNTVSYTAPELFLGKKPTQKCDIYSLGITFWEIQNQILPFEGLTSDFIIYNVCKNKLRPVSTKFESTEFDRIYKICWSEEPNIRPNIIELSKLIHTL